MTTRKITAEEKKAQIEEARECFEEANRLIEKGNKLIKMYMRGVEMCDMSNNCEVIKYPAPYKGLIEVHLYSGMSKLERLFGKKAEPMVDFCGDNCNDRKALCIGGIKFMQIGKPTQSRYCYK